MQNDPKPSPYAKKKSKVLPIALFFILVVALLVGFIPKIENNKKLDKEATEEKNSVPVVQVTSASMKDDPGLVLSGSIQALTQTAVQARTTGYISKLYVDIGSRVKKGQVLAEITSPDVDQQVAQASADTSKSVATVGQSQADVIQKEAGVLQTRADVSRQGAAIKQAQAAEISSEAKYEQTLAGLASDKAKLAQVKQGVELQKANLDTAQAQYQLAATTVKRYESLLKEGFVAQQDYDQAAATFKTQAASYNATKANYTAAQEAVNAAVEQVNSSAAVANSAKSDIQAAKENVKAAQELYHSVQATVDAAKANVRASQSTVSANRAAVGSSVANQRRYEVLRSFQQVVAPFDGIITARNVDVGSLVNPGTASDAAANTSATSTTGLFGIASIDQLRILVSIPQTYYSSIPDGSKASVTVTELPKDTFMGTVFHQSGALDPTTRTLLTEVRLDNKKGTLLPGMFTTVRFKTQQMGPALHIPSATLVNDATGTHVAVVGDDGVLHFKPIVLGRDYGTEVEVVSGVTLQDKLIANPTDDMKDGEKVKVDTSNKQQDPSKS